MIALALTLALAAEPAATLTLEEARRQAVAHQPLLQGYQHQREQAEARLVQARSAEYPQVSAAAELFAATANNTATSYLTPPDFVRVGTRPAAEKDVPALAPFVDSLAGVGAHYQLLDFGYTRGTVGAAQAGVEASQALGKQALQDVLLRVSEAYLAAVAAEQTLAVARDGLQRTQAHHDLAAAGVRSGFKPPIDLARSEAELAAARLSVIRAENAAEVARTALDTAIGWAPPGPYALAAPDEDTAPVPDEPLALDQARQGRADLAALRAQARAADFQLTAAASGDYPRLLASSSASLRGFDGPPTTINWDVGLVLSYPLFTGFLVRGQRQEAEARLAELRSREQVLDQAVAYQLRQARHTLLSAREAIAASQKQVEGARASLDLAEGRYKQGLGNIVELTDAQAQYDAAQLGLVQSRLAAAVSRAQLEHARAALPGP